LPLGIVGDVHLAYDDEDSRLLDGQGYDLVLFVGDLAELSFRQSLGVARCIANLRTPTYVIPGNHDAANVGQLAAEVLKVDPIIPLLGIGQPKRADALREALWPAVLSGFSRHPIEVDGRRMDLVAARPHSVGGAQFAFRPYLEARFGVRNFEESAARMKRIVDQCVTDDLIFLAHNGPSGLGARAQDIWGCDFRKDQGDFGDRDLAEAIAYAKSLGKRVHAVVAGHMHHALRTGGQRQWIVVDDGVTYVNAARVPRILHEGARELRHHVRLRFEGDEVVVEEVLLEAGPA
jgi:uncharacterized protein (TIGR04168 family)